VFYFLIFSLEDKESKKSYASTKSAAGKKKERGTYTPSMVSRSSSRRLSLLPDVKQVLLNGSVSVTSVQEKQKSPIAEVASPADSTTPSVKKFNSRKSRIIEQALKDDQLSATLTSDSKATIVEEKKETSDNRQPLSRKHSM
jgi:hypothetical protein